MRPLIRAESGSVLIGALVLVIVASIAIPHLFDLEIFSQRASNDAVLQQMNRLRAIEASNMIGQRIFGFPTATSQIEAFNSLFPPATESSTTCASPSISQVCPWLMKQRNHCPSETRTISSPQQTTERRTFAIYACRGTNKCSSSNSGGSEDEGEIRLITCVTSLNNANSSPALSVSIYRNLESGGVSRFIPVETLTH